VRRDGELTFIWGEKISMIDWGLAVKICVFGLSAVFGSLALLIGAIYAFEKILKILERRLN
jgi:hypothetical protein